MLNRRILRIKAFKVLYSYAENPDLSLKEALSGFEVSCEATRDLYLYMLGIIPALTAVASRRRAESSTPPGKTFTPISSSSRTACRPFWSKIRIFRNFWKRKKCPGSRTTLSCTRCTSN